MSNEYSWYATLVKPLWAPPSWLFGPVWTVLYLGIAVSFGYIFYQISRGKYRPVIGLPFVLNLFFNLLFTPIQFGLKNNFLAALDILLVLGTLLWLMKIAWQPVRWVAIVNIPYLGWVAFATILQLTITYLNW